MKVREKYKISALYLQNDVVPKIAVTWGVSTMITVTSLLSVYLGPKIDVRSTCVILAM